MSNDNLPETRAELEVANRGLRTSLKKSEALVEECREKLATAQARLSRLDSDSARQRQRDARREA